MEHVSQDPQAWLSVVVKYTWAVTVFSVVLSVTSPTRIPSFLAMAVLWQARTLFFLSLVLNALAAITRYIPEGQETLFHVQPSTTDSSPPSSYTGSAADDPRTLVPPVPPTDPPVNTHFAVQLVNGNIPGLSIPQHGAFLGFSIELSVSNHIRESRLSFL